MDRSRKIFEVNVEENDAKIVRNKRMTREWRRGGVRRIWFRFREQQFPGGVEGEGKVGVKERAEFVRKQERRVSSYPTNVKRETIDAEGEGRSRA